MADRAALLETLRTAAKGLPDVVEKKMFGCEALFTQDRVFALLWKEGRIGVKLPDPEKLAALLGQAGASPWTPGGRQTMSNWALVPPAMHAAKKLQPWLQLAHALAPSSDGAKKKAAKKPAAKKKTAAPAKKKTAAKAKAKSKAKSKR